MSTKNPLHQAILKTLVYAHAFAFTPTPQEICHFLLSEKKYAFVYVSRAIQELFTMGIVCKKTIGGKVCIALSQKRALFARRARVFDEELRKQREVERARSWLWWIPTISALYVTGGVAVHNALPQDDVDFLVITKSGWLWTTRLLVVVLSLCLGTYRKKYAKETKNSWCFNLWLDETALVLPQSKRTEYVAHEVLQASVIFEKDGIHSQFLRKNSWVKKYLANGYAEAMKKCARVGTDGMKKNNVGQMLRVLWEPIEHILYVFQCAYMRSSMTTEKVGKHEAWFHPRKVKILMK